MFRYCCSAGQAKKKLTRLKVRRPRCRVEQPADPSELPCSRSRGLIWSFGTPRQSALELQRVLSELILLINSKLWRGQLRAGLSEIRGRSRGLIWSFGDSSQSLELQRMLSLILMIRSKLWRGHLREGLSELIRRINFKHWSSFSCQNWSSGHHQLGGSD